MKHRSPQLGASGRPASAKEQLGGLFVGVDGCKGGWLCFTVDMDAGDTGFALVPDFARALTKYKCAKVVAVDIPIGLPESGARACDIQARQLLGKPRASSIFPAPIRSILGATTYKEACRKSLMVGGKKISQQTFNILPKVQEVDEVLSPGLQSWVYEVHPEICFWKLNGGQAMRFKKRSEAGRRERLSLLSRPFPEIRHHLDQLDKKQAEPDDLLDAAAAAWTAVRIARKEATRIPEKPEFDSTGLRMEIFY
jgi:predicted RNase H-like nuclease